MELTANFDRRKILFNLIVKSDCKEFGKSDFSWNCSKVDLFVEKLDFYDLWQLLFLSTKKFSFPFDKSENKNLSTSWLVDWPIEMLSSLHTGVSRVLRASGQALDVIGQSLEVSPMVDKCEFSSPPPCILALALSFKAEHHQIFFLQWNDI